MSIALGDITQIPTPSPAAAATDIPLNPASKTFKQTFADRVMKFGLPRAIWFLVVGAPKTNTLRPVGHIGFIERSRVPIMVGGSFALTTIATYTLMKPLLTKVNGQISFEILLALGGIAFSGLMLDCGLLTSALRSYMHAMRKEWGWFAVSVIMLTLFIATEAATSVYFFYEIDPGILPVSMQVFMSTQMPVILFFARALMPPVALGYLIIVRPFTIRRIDVDNTVVSRVGSAVISLVDKLTEIANVQTLAEGANLLSLLLAIFRNGSHENTESQDTLLANSFQALHGGIGTQVPTANQSQWAAIGSEVLGLQEQLQNTPSDARPGQGQMASQPPQTGANAVSSANGSSAATPPIGKNGAGQPNPLLRQANAPLIAPQGTSSVASSSNTNSDSIRSPEEILAARGGSRSTRGGGRNRPNE